MPTYDYRCNGCDKEIEVVHSIKETMHKCPFCEKWSLKRVFKTSTPFILKGSKWFKKSGNY